MERTDTMPSLTKLPSDIEQEIFHFLPPQDKVSLDRANYERHHATERGHLYDRGSASETRLRQLICRDMMWVFQQVIREKFSIWVSQRGTVYKNMVFSNYIYFLFYYSQEQGSAGCSQIIQEYLETSSLWKTLHKKKVVKYKRYNNHYIHTHLT